MKQTIDRVLTAALLTVTLATDVGAQTGSNPYDLSRKSLEDLLNIRITIANRKEQPAGEVPAAVSVLSKEDIRRSGMRTLPELLRLVPGVQVARVDGSRWAVSVRGFNDLYANKLLVLVDGRSIYNRVFSGVFWSTQDMLVDDIERIEIVRGPGGAVWGANAVNGVINVVTKAAADTQGTLVRVGSGTIDHAQAAVRHGGTIGSVAYRVSSQWSGHGASLLESGGRATDNWNSFANALRAEWTRGGDALTVSGSFMKDDARSLWLTPVWASMAHAAPGAAPNADDWSTAHDAGLIARWAHTRPDGSELQVQSSLTHRHLDNVRERESERTANVDVQYQTRIGQRHDVVVGSGVKSDRYESTGSFVFTFNQPTGHRDIFSVFGQDEISMGKRLRVTLGSKAEREAATGWSLQPTARALWTIVPAKHQVWFATSRAIRTPSAIDLDMRVNYASLTGPDGTPILVGGVGNPAFRTEQFADLEAGYRVQIGSSVSLDATAFHGRYSRLRTIEPVAPQLELTPAPHIFMATTFGNLLDAETTGFEVAGHWAVAERWTIDGSYSGLRLIPHLSTSSGDQNASGLDGNAPRHQWQIRSSVQVGARTELSAALFRVGRLERLDIPAYVRADARMEFKISRRWSTVATGQNLLSRAHAEFDDRFGVLPTSVPRSETVQLVWRY